MSLTPGTRIGVYDVVEMIGVGGMGEVYRARDTKLNRDVAIKVLPAAFAQDAERLARITREAQLLASLNHPNIATIHGIEHNALVMELVEGDDLSTLIARGPMPLADALPIARQIADALEAAHEQGVVHRDLKPANIKVRADGTVKVLDFGLAKALAQGSGIGDQGSAGVVSSPTITSPANMTRAGVILGTAAYMSPEQARGKAVDRRADIWAFGAVLYEMLSGRRCFDGEDLSVTLATVIKEAPRWEALPAEVPAPVRRLLQRCLEKDPRRRLSAIADARLDLDEAQTAPALPSTITAPGPSADHTAGRSRASATVWRVACGVVALALAALATVHFRESPPDVARVLLSVPAPENSRISYPVLSPDGTKLLMLVIRDNERRLYVRDLDSDELRPLPGTDNARLPFWSPDSRYVGFSNGDLQVVSINGGAARTVCPGLQYTAATWGAGDTILVGVGGAINRASTSGGGCSPLKADQKGASYPSFLPDGQHFIYHDSRPDQGGTFIATLTDPVGRRVLPEPSISVLAPAPREGGRAHLLYLRGSDLMAQPFDTGTLTTEDEPFRVSASASPNLENGAVSASATVNGMLAWLTGFSTASRLTWVDRTGSALTTVGDEVDHQRISVSPSGAFLASLNSRSTVGDLVLTEVTRPASSTVLIPRRSIPQSEVGLSIWTLDGSAIWMSIRDQVRTGLFRKPVDGGPLELLQETDRIWNLTDWSRDGSYLVYVATGKATDSDIWYVPVHSGKLGQPESFVATPGVDSQAKLSPDGKWLAYYSGPATKGDVYIRPFPSGSGAWRVSLNYGAEPRWRADGKELYFVSNAADANEYSHWSASVDSDGRGGLTVGRPRKMFEARLRRFVEAQNSWSYWPAPDGQRFLLNLSAAQTRPAVNVMLNWAPPAR